MPELSSGDGLTVCLLMNFANPRLEIRRRVNGF